MNSNKFTKYTETNSVEEVLVSMTRRLIDVTDLPVGRLKQVDFKSNSK